MKTVAVSGLTGMIGKNLIDQYSGDNALGDSFKLIAFTRYGSDTSNLERCGVEYRRVDYGDPKSFEGKVEDVDAFLHLAGLTKAVTPAGYYRVNVEGTSNLLEALSRYGGRIRHFIFISSTAASGPAPLLNGKKREEDPCRPVSHYGRSKLQAEALVRSCPFNWTVIRLPLVFGPYDHDMLYMFRLARSGMIVLFADPGDPYTYVAAPDVGRFLLRALFDERLFGNTFFFCYDSTMPGREFFPLVRRQLGLPERYRYVRAPRWIACPARFILDVKQRLTGRTTIVNPDKVAELAARYWIFSNEKLKRTLNLESINNDRAVAETIQWYQDHHLL